MANWPETIQQVLLRTSQQNVTDIAQILQSFYNQTQNIAATMHRSRDKDQILGMKFCNLSLRIFN